MRKSITRAIGQPLVQFIVLGIVFYALYAWIRDPGTTEPDDVIRVTAADVNRLDAAWRARWNRPPTEEELTGLVDAHVREVALYRHAVAMGLDQNDVVIRRMLGQKLQTLTQNLVELSLSPTDQELRAYFDADMDQYRDPDLITFSQLFLDPDRRGNATLPDAERILEELRARSRPTEDIDPLGDSFMLQRYYPGKSRLDVSRLFGQGFTQSIFELAPGEWHGPVLSGYGVHLVYVHDLARSPNPVYDAVQDRVKQDWMDDKRKELQDAYVNEVMARYEIVYEETPPELPDQRAEAESEASP